MTEITDAMCDLGDALANNVASVDSPEFQLRRTQAALKGLEIAVLHVGIEILFGQAGDAKPSRGKLRQGDHAVAVDGFLETDPGLLKQMRNFKIEARALGVG